MDKSDYKILIVDDMAYIRLQVKKMLASGGFGEIREAADGVAAITACREFRPDIIVLDIHLPKINGLDLIGFFLTINPESRILICSVEHRNGVYEKALSLGAVDFVEKPVTEKEFLAKIGRLMEKRAGETGKKLGTFMKGERDFSEQIGIKLDMDHSLQTLSLYGLFDESMLHDLSETVLSTKIYGYRNVLLNLNGVTQFRLGPEKLRELKEAVEKERGRFMVILIRGEFRKQLEASGLENCIVKTEIQAKRKLK